MLTAHLHAAVIVALGLALGAASGLLAGPILRRVPPPTLAEATDAEGIDAGSDEPRPPCGPTGDPVSPTPVMSDGDAPPDYAALATPRFRLGCGTLAAAASVLVLVLAPWPWLPLWLVWSTLFALLVSVDAATTWLPLGLTRLVWLAAAGALVLAAVPALAELSVTAAGTGQAAGPGHAVTTGQAAGPGQAVDPRQVVDPGMLGQLGRTLLGAAAAGGMYLLLWRVGRGLGFGDVRISPMLGALGASLSWDAWWLTMLAGPLLGALWGVARTAMGRRGPYAYGPWMWLGPAAALVAQGAGPVGS